MMTGRRITGALAGALVGALAYAIAHLLLVGVHISGVGSIVMLFLPGLIVGAAVGAAFPRPFIWLAELILDAWP
jgi:hypothetical protein